MSYHRLPRNTQVALTREQLRVYMMCDGQRSLDEIVQLTRLTWQDVGVAIEDLLSMNLLTGSNHESPVAAPVLQEHSAPSVQFPVQSLSDRLCRVLDEQLGVKAAPYTAQLQACPDENSMSMLVPRLIAKIKLTVNREAAEALQNEYQRQS